MLCLTSSSIPQPLSRTSIAKKSSLSVREIRHDLFGTALAIVALGRASVNRVEHDIGRRHMDRIRITHYVGQPVLWLVTQIHSLLGGRLPVSSVAATIRTTRGLLSETMASTRPSE